jgi:DHA3 family macrolide efflux protein-like MFS transporter
MGLMKRVLHNRSLVIMGIAESVSGIGSWITMMAMFALIVFRNEGSVAQSSGIFLAVLIPMMLFSPLAGWLADRIDRKWLMIGSELVSGLVVSGLIVAEKLPVIYGLLALQAGCASIMMPARQAAVPAVVEQELLTQANALMQQLAGIVKIGAPILAGLVLSVLSPHQAIILDVISFGLSALILSLLPALPAGRRAGETTEQAPAAAPARGAVWAALRANSGLWLLFGLSFLTILVIMGFDVFASVFTRDVLSGDESFFGLMIGLVGLGSVAGTGALMLRKKAGNPWRDVIIGMFMLAWLPAAVALVSGIDLGQLARPIMLATCLLGGVGSGLVVVQLTTLLQTLTPAAVLGQMSGIYQSMLIAGQLIALAVVPQLVPALLSMALYFSIATALIVLLALGAALIVRGGRAQVRQQPA